MLKFWDCAYLDQCKCTCLHAFIQIQSHIVQGFICMLARSKCKQSDQLSLSITVIVLSYLFGLELPMSLLWVGNPLVDFTSISYRTWLLNCMPSSEDLPKKKLTRDLYDTLYLY